MSLQDNRKRKVDMILATLRKRFNENPGDEGIDVAKLISVICIEIGCGHTSIKEILKDLEITGKISIMNGKAYYVDAK